VQTDGAANTASTVSVTVTAAAGRERGDRNVTPETTHLPEGPKGIHERRGR
jgi:hypothetical protein